MPQKKTSQLNGVASTVAATSVGKYLDKHPEAIEYAGRKAKSAVNIGLLFFGITVLGLGGALFYNLYWKNRFKRIPYDKSQRPATLDSGRARLKTDSIYTALRGFGANFERVYQALKGMGYNNYVAIYNAFGKRRPATSFSFGNKNDMTLSEWLQDQFSEDKLAKLRAQVGRGFF